MKTLKTVRYFFGVMLLWISSQVFGQGMWERNFRTRAVSLTEAVADRYRPPSMDIGDPEKYYWPKAMARFELYGQTDSVANAWIDALHKHPPFHFTLVGMARLMPKYWHAPAMGKHHPTLLEKVFARTDSHNPWTSEGTENHISMARTSGYIFAQEALAYPKLFPSAPQKLAVMKEWLLTTAEKILQRGTGEWNSSIYQVYSLMGWMNLYDFACDTDVVAAAKNVLDYYAAEMALHYSFGAYGGSEMRGNGAVEVDRTAGAYLSWLWFHPDTSDFPGSFEGSQYIQAMHAVTSSYRPPLEAIRLAQKSLWEKPRWFIGSKPSYLYEHPHFVKQFFYATSHYTLGSSVSPYGGWTGSTYQLVPWKLVVDGEDKPFLISGNGRFHDEWSGKTRNPWTQHAQYKNVLIQMTKTPEEAEALTQEAKKLVGEWAERWKEDFRERFPNDHKGNVVNFSSKVLNQNTSFLSFPEEMKLSIDKGICLGEIGEVYLIIVPLSGKTPLLKTLKDKRMGKRKILVDESPDGKICGFLLEVVDQALFDNWEDFTRQVNARSLLDMKKVKREGTVHYQSFLGDSIEATYRATGYFTEAMVDWGFGPTAPDMYSTAPPYQQPDWPTGVYHGRRPTLMVNGKTFDWDAAWPVYSGEGFEVREGRVMFE